MRSGSALFEERKGGRMRLKPRAIWGMSAMEGCRLALGMTARYPGRGQGRAASAQAAARELLRVLVEIRRRRMQA